MGPPLDDAGGRGAESPRSSLLRGALEHPRAEDRDRRSSSGGVGWGRAFAATAAWYRSRCACSTSIIPSCTGRVGCAFAHVSICAPSAAQRGARRAARRGRACAPAADPAPRARRPPLRFAPGPRRLAPPPWPQGPAATSSPAPAVPRLSAAPRAPPPARPPPPAAISAPAPRCVEHAAAVRGATSCPLSTGEGTRRVRLVRGKGRGVSV
jgi:hypothetical protein